MRMLKWQSDCHITLNENSTWHKIWGICKRQLRWRLFFSELKRRLMTLSTENLWVLSGNQNLCQCFLFLHFWYDMIITTITMWCVLYNVLKCIHAPFLCPPVPRYLSVPVPQIRFIISNQLAQFFLENSWAYSPSLCFSNTAFTRGCTAQRCPHSLWSCSYGWSVLVSCQNKCNMHVMNAEDERNALSYPYRNPDLVRDDSWLVWLILSWLNYEWTQATR